MQLSKIHPPAQASPTPNPTPNPQPQTWAGSGALLIQGAVPRRVHRRHHIVAEVTPQLATIQIQQGVDQFKVVMDNTNNSDLDIEQNRLNGRIVLVPTRAVEFIAIDFIITNSGVSFE